MGISGVSSRRKTDPRETGAQTWLDKIVLLLLILPIFVSVVLLGGARIWVAFPVLSVIYIALALYFIRPRSHYRLMLPPGFICLILFLLYGGYQWIFNTTLIFATRNEMLQVIAYVFILLAFCDLCRPERVGKNVLVMVFFFTALIAWHALYQHVHDSNMVFINIQRHSDYGMRASGTYICPNHFAHLLVMVMVMAFAVLFTRGMGTIPRLFSAYAFIVIAPVLLLTGSRSGWLGIVAGLAVTATLMVFKRSRAFGLFFIILFPLLMTSLGYGLWQFSPLFKKRVEQAIQGDIRQALWSDTMPLIKSKPVMGYGPGSFREVFPEYRKKFNTPGRYLRYAHNEYLHTLAEYGVIGLTLLLLTVGIVCIRVFIVYVRAGPEKAGWAAGLLGAIAGSMVHAIFDFQFHMFANCLLAALFAGVVFAIFYDKESWKPLCFPLWLGRLLFSLLAFGMLALGVLSLQVFAGYRTRQQAEQLKRDLKPEKVLAQYALSARIDPLHFKPYQELGHSYKSRAFWNRNPQLKEEYAKQALVYYDQALARNSRDIESLYAKAKVEAQLGNVEGALEKMQALIPKDPYNIFYRIQYGLTLKKHKRYNEALKVFEDAHKIDRRNETIHINLQQLRALIKQAE